MPELIGGSADLTPSNLTKVPGNAADYSPADRVARYLRFGVREHGMCAVCNGLAAYGGLVPFGATFLTFVGYALGSIRLSSLSHFRVLYIMTHDSIGLGEDGPTHQPIETLASLRSMPNMLVIRPADGNEVAGAYKLALENAHGPTVLALSRQGCVNLAASSIEAVARGAYPVLEPEGGAAPVVVLAATGSEVQLCLAAAAALSSAGVAARVVSFPCWSLFDAQPAEYRASVFPAGVPVLAVEALAGFGWEKYSHAQVCMRTFGASGKGPELYKHFVFTAEAVADKAQKMVAHYAGAAPTLERPAF